MPLLAQYLSFLLLPLVLGAPTASVIQKRSFKVDRVPNPQYEHRSPGAGTRALVRAYRKHLVPLPPGLLDAIAAAANGGAHALNGFTSDDAVTRKTGAEKPNGGIGEVTASPEGQDIQYLAPVTIGGQTLNLNFDSGSADFWVFNTQLAVAAQTGHVNYDPRRSSTFRFMPGSSYNIRYGDGSGSTGNVGTDTVNIGGVTVTGQAVQLATAVSAAFIADTASSGLLGLSYSALNTVQPRQQKTFFDNVMPSLAEPVWTADLRKQAVGSYEFGRIDPAKFNGTLQWAPVDTASGFWQVASENFIVGDGPLQKIVVGAQAIIDTGTTLMLAAPALINAYYSQIAGAVNNITVGGITVPCNADLPDLHVDMGTGFMATVRGSDINFAPVDTTNERESLSVCL